MTEAEIIGKKVDLPPDAYHTVSIPIHLFTLSCTSRDALPNAHHEQGKEVTRFAPRPGHNTDGKPIKVQLNIFQVNRIPRGDIFQYDVSLTPS